MNKCNGCGVLLQSNNIEKEGFVSSLAKEKNLCERCFRIKNYNEYKKVEKTNNDFIPILEKIDKTNDLVVLIVDIFCMNQDVKQIRKYINNDLILVFTKRDLIPFSVSNEKLIEYSDNLEINQKETLLVSGIKSTGLDLLFEKIERYKKTNNVYIIGYTNAGKSTLINKIIYHYSDNFINLTTSMLSSTTLNTVEIKVNENLTLIDTPGIIEKGNIVDKVDINMLKKILPKKEIRPITYQMKSKQTIIIEDILRIEAEKNNLTLYFSNQLKIDRYYNETDKLEYLQKNIIKVKKGEDIVILGLGFIKCTNTSIISIYTLPDVSVYTRKSLI